MTSKSSAYLTCVPLGFFIGTLLRRRLHATLAETLEHPAGLKPASAPSEGAAVFTSATSAFNSSELLGVGAYCRLVLVVTRRSFTLAAPYGFRTRVSHSVPYACRLPRSFWALARRPFTRREVRSPTTACAFVRYGVCPKPLDERGTKVCVPSVFSCSSHELEYPEGFEPPSCLRTLIRSQVPTPFSHGYSWSSRLDSNERPPPCQSDALPLRHEKINWWTRSESNRPQVHCKCSSPPWNMRAQFGGECPIRTDGPGWLRSR